MIKDAMCAYNNYGATAYTKFTILRRNRGGRPVSKQWRPRLSERFVQRRTRTLTNRTGVPAIPNVSERRGRTPRGESVPFWCAFEARVRTSVTIDFPSSAVFCGKYIDVKYTERKKKKTPLYLIL